MRWKFLPIGMVVVAVVVLLLGAAQPSIYIPWTAPRGAGTVTVTTNKTTGIFTITGAAGSISFSSNGTLVSATMTNLNLVGFTLVTNANGSISIGAPTGGGETNTASNVGNGVRLFDSKSGVDLRFNTLSNTTDTAWTSNANVFTVGLSATTSNRVQQALTNGVTSVGLAVPSIFGATNSPITSSGTLGFTNVSQTANTVYAGPASGSAAGPTFRALGSADMPASVLTNGWIRLQIQSSLMPTNNMPGLDTGSNYVWRLLFDDTTDEITYWTFELPSDYSTNATVYSTWSMLAGAASKTNVFQFATQVLSMTGTNNINVDNFSSPVSITNIIPTVAGWATNMSANLGISASAGDLVRLRVNRNATNTTDSAVGDAALHSISIRYTKQ